MPQRRIFAASKIKRYKINAKPIFRIPIFAQQVSSRRQTFCEEYYISTTMLGSNPPLLQLRMVTRKGTPLQPCTTPLRRGRAGAHSDRYPSPGGSTDFGADSGPDSFAASVVVAVASPGWTASVHPRTTTVFLLTSSHLPGIPLFLLSSQVHSLFLLSSFSLRTIGANTLI